jgi:hypothetical protein
MGHVLLRLWLIASVIWAGVVYWSAGVEHEPDWQGVAFWPPAAVIILAGLVQWAFRGYRRGS